MNIGRKIYYEKSNGIVIWDKGEMSGAVQETTMEQDRQACPLLKIIPEERLGVIQLPYGQNAEDFSRCKGYRINPITQKPEFVFDE